MLHARLLLFAVGLCAFFGTGLSITLNQVAYLQTQDANNNAKLDHILILFCSPAPPRLYADNTGAVANFFGCTALPSLVNLPPTAIQDFKVEGYTIKAISQVNGNHISIELVEGDSFDTGATPIVVYDPQPGSPIIQASASIQLTSGQLNACVDMVSPQIVAARVFDTDKIRLTFSEPVARNDIFAPINAISFADFSLCKFSGPTCTSTLATMVLSATSVPEIDNDNFVILQFTSPFAPGHYISITSSKIVDQAGTGNAARTISAVFPLSNDALTPMRIRTMDIDHNGKIDTVQLVYNYNILDSSLATATFEVAGYTVLSHATGIKHNAGPLYPHSNNDPNYFLFVQETAAVSDTAATPAVSMTGATAMGEVADVAVSLAAANLVTQDGCPPLLLSAKGQLDSPQQATVVFLFSELVTSVSTVRFGVATDFTISPAASFSNITWTLTAGTPATASSGTQSLTFTLTNKVPGSGALSATSFAAFAVSVNSFVVDMALLKNAAVVVPRRVVPVVNTDAVAPELVKVVTLDLTGGPGGVPDGVIDHVRFFFKEAMDKRILPDPSAISQVTYLPSVGGEVEEGVDGSHVFILDPANSAKELTLKLNLPSALASSPDTAMGIRLKHDRTGITGAPLLDVNGNVFAAGVFLAVDGSPPVLLDAFATVGDKNLTLVFSEKVLFSPDASLLTLNSSVASSFAFSSCSNPASSARITCVLAGGMSVPRTAFLDALFPFTVSLLTRMEVTGLKGVVLDLGQPTANYAQPQIKALRNSDKTPPTIISATTISDSTSLGTWNSIKLVFSKPMDPFFTSSSSGFSINTGGAAFRILSVSSGDLTVSPAVISTEVIIELQFSQPGNVGCAVHFDGAFVGRLLDSHIVQFPAVSSTVTATDGVRPLLMHARANGAGSTFISLSFSEVVQRVGGGAVLASDFLLNDPLRMLAVGSFSLVTVDSMSFNLTLNSPLTSNEFGNLTVTGLQANLVDVNGNAIVGNPVVLFNTDNQAPRFVQAYTAVDPAISPPTGRLNRIVVVFSEDIVFATVNASDWEVNGFVVDAVTSKNGAFTPSITLQVTSKAVGSTVEMDGHLTPTVTYVGNRIVDQTGRFVDTDVSRVAIDRIAPVLLTVQTNAQASIHDVLYVFSEPIAFAPLFSPLTPELSFGFVLATELNKPQKASLLTSAPAVVAVNFIAALNKQDFGKLMSLAINTVVDTAPVANAVPAAQKVLSKLDAVSPVFVKAMTTDLDKNGLPDGIVLVFDKPMDLTVFTLSALTVDGMSVVPATAPMNPLVAGVVNKNAILIRLQEVSTVTGASTPAVRYTALDLSDYNGNLVGSTIDTVADDGVAPVIVSFTAILGYGNLGRITFSEPVDTNDNGNEDVHAVDFLYADVNGQGSVGFAIVDGDGTDSVISIELPNLSLSDFGVDTIAVLANQIFDLPDRLVPPRGQPNSVVSQTVTLQKGDLNPPKIAVLSVTGKDAVETQDMNGDFLIDRFRLSFDDNIDFNTLDAADFQAGASADGLTVKISADGVRNGNVVFLDVSSAIAKDPKLRADMTPTITFLAGGKLTDLNGNLLASPVTWSSQDKVAFGMTVASVVGSTQLKVTFSEPVFGVSSVDSSLRPMVLSDFRFIGFGISSKVNVSSLAVTSVANEPTALTLTLTSALFWSDFVEVTQAKLNIEGVVDRALNLPIVPTVGVVNTDKTAPKIVSAFTADLNGNGRIDHIRIVFDEPIDDVKADERAFTVSNGYIVTGVNKLAGTVNDEELMLSLKEGNSTSPYDTAATPTVFYKRIQQGVTDVNNNELADSLAPLKTQDGAPPVIVGARAKVGVAALTISFSEPVTTSTTGSGAVLTADIFTYQKPVAASPGGASAIVSIQSAASGAQNSVDVTLDAPITLANIKEGDVVVLKAGSVLGANAEASTLASSTAIFEPDSTPPRIKDAFSREEGIGESFSINGKMDLLEIIFTEPIDDSSVQLSHFRLSGFPGLDSVDTYVYTILNFTTGATANDATIFLKISEGQKVDGHNRPTLIYTPPAPGAGGATTNTTTTTTAGITTGLIDLAGLQMLQSNVTVQDGMSPVLLHAAGSLGGKTLLLTFSEAVGDVQHLPVALEAFAYTNTNANGATKIVGIVNGNADVKTSNVIILTVDVAFLSTDLSTENTVGDSVILLPNSVYDGNSNVGITLWGSTKGIPIQVGVPAVEEDWKDSISMQTILIVVACLCVCHIVSIYFCMRRRKRLQAERTRLMSPDEIMKKYDKNQDGVLDAHELAEYVKGEGQKTKEDDNNDSDDEHSQSATPAVKIVVTEPDGKSNSYGSKGNTNDGGGYNNKGKSGSYSQQSKSKGDDDDATPETSRSSSNVSSEASVSRSGYSKNSDDE